MEHVLYTCIVEEYTSEEAFFQNYWCHASHPGQAIQKVMNAAKLNGLINPFVRQLDYYDINDLDTEVAPAPTAEIFWSTGRIFFPPEKTFRIPIGVIPASPINETQNEPDDIVDGYTMSRDDKGLIRIQVNVESDQLFFLYSQLLALNSNYKVFWYIIHLDEEEMLFLVNEHFNTPDEIIKHLQDNHLDSIQNGLVTITAYLEEGATNLNISDHKRIIIITYSKTLSENYTLFLERSGYVRKERLIAIDCEMAHWHYRLPGSKDKEELIKMLKKLGFEDWDPSQSNNREEN